MYALTHSDGMKKPSLLVKKNLEWLIELRKTNPHELQRVTGVPQPTIHRILSGESTDPRTSTLQPLADYFRVTVAELRDRDLESSVTLPLIYALETDVETAPEIVKPPRRIPVVGRVQAGADGLLHIDDYNSDHPDGFLLWYANCPESYALRIRGESMSPRYLPGEFVGVDPCAEVLPSDEVIVLLKDGRRMIKRLLWARDDQACFESVNKDHPNIVIDCAEIDRMHLVLGHIPKQAFRT
jgi:SOS-response transcriptional repressor LexA